MEQFQLVAFLGAKNGGGASQSGVRSGEKDLSEDVVVEADEED